MVLVLVQMRVLVVVVFIHACGNRIRVLVLVQRLVLVVVVCIHVGGKRAHAIVVRGYVVLVRSCLLEVREWAEMVWMQRTRACIVDGTGVCHLVSLMRASRLVVVVGSVYPPHCYEWVFRR